MKVNDSIEFLLHGNSRTGGKGIIKSILKDKIQVELTEPCHGLPTSEKILIFPDEIVANFGS
jgi:hypothetical protein